mmetsp:Transcript_135867/g.290419  ORF Transcript_135867/g.290419 Transcript_135867/m.290419 type:complete len:222 (+) Transcript_135867:1-666(+)
MDYKLMWVRSCCTQKDAHPCPHGAPHQGSCLHHTPGDDAIDPASEVEYGQEPREDDQADQQGPEQRWTITEVDVRDEPGCLPPSPAQSDLDIALGLDAGLSADVGAPIPCLNDLCELLLKGPSSSELLLERELGLHLSLITAAPSGACTCGTAAPPGPTGRRPSGVASKEKAGGGPEMATTAQEDYCQHRHQHASGAMAARHGSAALAHLGFPESRKARGC